MEWGAGIYNQPIGFTENADNSTDGFIVHASGLVTQVVVSEIILQFGTGHNAYTHGVMAWNIVNPIVYALDYWLLRRENKESGTSYQGDIEGVEAHSNERTASLFAGGMALIAIMQWYRYTAMQDSGPQWMQRNDVRLNLRASGRSLALMLEINF
jgi:hypothetical protein